MPPDAVATVVDFERIDGVSSDWTMGHVRAGKEVFRKEIEPGIPKRWIFGLIASLLARDAK